MKKQGDLCMEAQRLNTVWKRNDRPVLQLTGVLPRFPDRKPLNAYYRRLERQLQDYCLKRLLPLLPEDAPVLTLRIGYETAFSSDRLLSITCDLQRLFRGTEASEAVQQPGMPAARFAAVWDLPGGTPLPLKQFLRAGTGRLRQLLAAEARSRLEAGQALYYPDCGTLARRCFSRDNFYIREDGIVLFYPPLTLGPKAEGIPQFFFPWSESWLKSPEEAPQRSCIAAPLRAIIPTSQKRRDR